MSSKLPYYRMYPKDFDTDAEVRLMSMCELGLYIKCLNHSWINGSLPDDLKKIAKIVGETLANVKKTWPGVAKKFVKTSDGTLINERLERERKYASERHLSAKKAVEIRDAIRDDSEGEDSEKGDDPRAGARSASASESASPAAVLEEGAGETFFEEPQDAKEFVDEALKLYKRGGGKLDWRTGARSDFAEWLCGLSEPQASVLAALRAFLGDGYWRKEHWPWKAFKKQLSRYLEAASEQAKIDAEPVLPGRIEPPTLAVSLVVPSWDSDPEYREYLRPAAEGGVRLDPTECEQAYREVFCHLIREHRLKSSEDYAYLVSIRGPQYVKGPLGHLRGKPWNVLRVPVPPPRKKTLGEINAEGAMELGRQIMIARGETPRL